MISNQFSIASQNDLTKQSVYKVKNQHIIITINHSTNFRLIQ